MEIPEKVKANWPYYVGGVIGVYLVWRFLASRSAASAPASSSSLVNPAMYAAQASAGLAASNQANQMQLAEDTLNASTQIAAGKNAVNWLAAQGQVAQQVGAAAGQFVAALQAPTIAAINGSNIADTVALQSAAGITGSAFAADTAMTKIAADSTAYTGSVINAGDALIGHAYDTAQQVYGQNVDTATKVAGTVAIANAQANAAVAIAPYQAQVGTAQAQATQAVGVAQADATASAASSRASGQSDSSMWGAIGSAVPAILGAFL